MNTQFLKDSFGWGFVLWVIGFILGIALFKVVPPSTIGWIITPIGIVITLWVLLKIIKPEFFTYYVKIAVIWTGIAIACDYIFLVKAFNVQDYYKPDIYLYYIVTFFLPVLVGSYKNKPVE